MPTWLIIPMSLAGALVAFNVALLLFLHSRVMHWLTRPIRARFWMRWSGMSYKQALAILRIRDTRDRVRHSRR